jgi:hypothetical protein
MTHLRQASITVAHEAPWEAAGWYAPPSSSYPATWATVEDEELPLLDARLVARARGCEAAMALSRLDSMIRERLRHRTVRYSAAATALIRDGVDENWRSRQENSSEGPATPDAGPWAKACRLATTATASFGREGRISRARDALLLHTLALESLRLLSASISRRQLVRENAGAVTRGAAQSDPGDAETAVDNPAVAALCAAFSGFNTAYLFPQHAFQAELLAAAAWLGWRMDGRCAPIPATAADYLAELDPAAAAEMADPNDPQAVIRFALDASGVDLNKLGQYASQQWPSRRPYRPIRSRRGVSAVMCRRFIETVGSS